MEEKLCAFCNQPFVPRSSYQRYCKRPHYMNCPVCGKKYLVTNNENLKRPPVACSYACRRAKANQTCLEKYGNRCAANGEEQRKLSAATMMDKYGVRWTFQSDKLVAKGRETMLEKYGAEHPMHIEGVPEEAAKLRQELWRETILRKFPLKMQAKESAPLLGSIDEDEMSVYMLRDKESVEFLKKNGHRVAPKWGRVHKSLGLVLEGRVYQVLRFEKSGSDIFLADFGTAKGYYNSNNFTKLIDAAISILNLDSFKCYIPRSLATLDLTYSLSVELVERGMYKVFWKISEEKLKKLTIRDDINEMKQRFDYITTDYLDLYHYVPQQGRHFTLEEEIKLFS